MRPIIRFERVSKSYRLRQDRPRSFREVFISRSIRNLWRRTDKPRLQALDNVSFDVQPGEAIGLIGPNGAGKSTVLKLIGRVIAPNSGRVIVLGRVAALLELGAGFHPDLSGRENIHLSGALAGLSRVQIRRKFASILAFAELESFIDMPVKYYSSGMYARLAFAVGVHLDPEVLLVDEILAVGDQAFQIKCLDRIGELKRRGVTICLVTHSPDLVRSTCNRAIWLDHGRIVGDGVPDALLSQYLDHLSTLAAQRIAPGAGLDTSQRWGSGRIDIVDVRLTDASGAAQKVFETGQQLVLNIDYTTHGPVPSAVFGMAIHRQDGLHITGPNSAIAGLDLPGLDGVGTVTYTVPYLPLLEGLYYVSVSAHNREDTELYDYHDRAYPFRVMNTRSSVREQYGLLTLRGTWAHMSETSRMR